MANDPLGQYYENQGYGYTSNGTVIPANPYVANQGLNTAGLAGQAFNQNAGWIDNGYGGVVPTFNPSVDYSSMMAPGYTAPTYNPVLPTKPVSTLPTSTVNPAGANKPATSLGDANQLNTSDPNQLIRDLMNMVLARQPQQNALTDQAATFLGQMQQMMQQSATKQDDLINAILNGGNGSTGIWQGIQDFINRQDTGLDPQALTALRAQNTSQIPLDYMNAAEQMRTELSRRGALGGGDMPGSAGDILRGYGPLEQARMSAIADAERQTILANQAQLNQNRQMAQNAIGQGSDLLGKLGDLYAPSQYINGNLGAINAGTNAFNAGTSNMNTTTGLANALAQITPGSLSHVIVSSLLSSLGSGLGNVLTSSNGSKGSIFGDILHGIIGIFGSHSPGAPDTKTALENYMDNSIGPNWRDYINSDDLEQLLAMGVKQPQ